jgi:Myb-like DNA-binding domain
MNFAQHSDRKHTPIMNDTSFICAGLLMLRRSSASSDSNSMMPEDSPPPEIQGQLDGRGALSKASSNNSSSMQVESPSLDVHPQVNESSTLSKASSSSNMQVESPPDELPAIRLQLDETTVRRVEAVHKRGHSDVEMDATTAPSTPDSDLSSGRDSPAPWLSSVEDICESPSKLRRTAAAAAADASGSSSSGLARGYYSFSDSEDENSDDSNEDSDSAAAASQQQQPAVTYTLVRKRKKKVSRYMGPPAVSAEPKVPNRGKKQDVRWFTAEEDEALTAAVQELGDTDWKLIAEQVGTRDAVQVGIQKTLLSSYT